MALKPKYSIVSSPVKAQRIFTDREEPRETFRKAIENFKVNDRNHSVINFYGFGGIGKTRLLNELSRTAKASEWNHIKIDMDDPIFHDCAFCLRSLRKQLSKDLYPKPSFRSFDFAYLIYLQKINPDITINDPSLEYLQTSDLMADIAKALFETLDTLPIANIITKIAVLGKKSVNFAERWWKLQGNNIFNGLHSLTPQEIKKHLPGLFANDLNESLYAKGAKPLCIFIDSYESMWEKASREGHHYQTDEWVKEWIASHTNILFIIAGRDKLRWEKENKDWDGIVDHHILEMLSIQDSRSFLDNCSIDDEQVKDLIVANSKGVPFYLDVAVDTYQKISMTRSPTIEDFKGKTQRAILDRFIRNLDREESATFKVLASCREFNQQLFQALIKEFQTGYPATNLDRLIEHSFIQEPHENSFSINPLMKKALLDHQSDDLKTEISSFLFAYFFMKITDITSEASIGYRNLIEANYYIQYAKVDTDTYNRFLYIQGKAYQQQCQMDKALETFERLARQDAQPEIIGDAKVQISMTLRQHGQNHKALDVAESVLKEAEQQHLKLIKCRALIQKGLCHFSLAKTSHLIESYEVSFDCYDTALTLAKSLESLPDILYCQLSMSTVMEYLDLVDESIELLNDTKVLAQINNHQHSYIDCLNGLARKYLIRGKYRKAISIAEEGLKLWQKAGFIRGQLVMCSHLMNAHAAIGSKRIDIEEIIELATDLEQEVTEQVPLDMHFAALDKWRN